VSFGVSIQQTSNRDSLAKTTTAPKSVQCRIVVQSRYENGLLKP
jgi:hypothetical protein